MFRVLLFIVVALNVSNGNEFTSRKKFRVVNGEIVLPKEIPYMVYLRLFQQGHNYYRTGSCGGSIIRADIVLSAAHCLKGYEPKHITAFTGIVFKAKPQESAQFIRGIRYFIHEQYNEATYNNDFGILFLVEPFDITPHVQSIELPSWNDRTDYTNLTALASGWGVDEKGYKVSRLYKTNMKIYRNEDCKWYTSTTITNNMICAAGQNYSIVCKGDSGGPLVHGGKLIGVVSWVAEMKTSPLKRKICNPNFPAFFSKVANYLDWIKIKTEYNDKINLMSKIN